MPALDLIAGPLWQKWALVLVHLLWQASLIAMLATAALYALRRKPAAQRYAVCLAAMLAITTCPLVTFFCVQPPPSVVARQPMATTGSAMFTSNAGDGREAMATGIAEPPIVDGETSRRQRAGVTEVARAIVEPTNAAPATTVAQTFQERGTHEQETSPAALSIYAATQPWIILAWQVGVLLLSVRLLVDYFQSRSLRLTGRTAPREMRELVAMLSRRLGLSHLPTLKCSKQIDQPVVLGLLKPMILLPASWITQLPPDMLTTLLVHELAHIRRHDLWINLLQRVVEIVFFFHPAVWWLSSRTRIERELCCDETVVAVTRDRLAYATTLEFAARQRLALVGPALGAQIGGSSMSLLHRVRNVLGIDAPASPRRNWLSGALALTVPVLIAGASLMLPTSPASHGPGTAFGEEKLALFDKKAEGERKRAEKDDDDDDDDERPRREEPRPREGEGERPRPPREGERPQPPREGRPEGDRPRPPVAEGDRPRPPAAREGEGRPVGPREGERRPEGEKPRPEAARGDMAELTALVREMRRELEQLRREVAELRAARGEGRPAPREGDRPAAREGERREGDRPLPPREGERREGDRPRPPAGEGDRPRDGERPRPPREGDR